MHSDVMDVEDVQIRLVKRDMYVWVAAMIQTQKEIISIFVRDVLKDT